MIRCASSCLSILHYLTSKLDESVDTFMPRERIFRIIEDRKSVKGKPLIYARSSYTDRQGKRHTLWRSGETKTEAKQRLKDALDRVEGGVIAVRTTFADLVKYYEENYVKQAVYKGDVKIEGTRAPNKVKSGLKPIVAYFGKMKLHNISYDDIDKYRVKRLTEPYVKGKDAAGEPQTRERAIASVNRELSLIRKMLNVAVGQSWLSVNPFKQGDGLISEAGEVQRQRILDDDEEGRILAACLGDGRRTHLKPIILCLIDTGMRKNEVLRLTWADADFEGDYLTAVSFKGKKRFARPVPMSARLKVELLSLRERSRALPTDRIFGVETDIKTSWTTIRRIAKLEDVRLHDLRHQAATNLIQSGMSLEETGKILGHLEPKTTWRYVNVSKETIKKARENLDKLHKKRD